jgi:hypothetical protein
MCHDLGFVSPIRRLCFNAANKRFAGLYQLIHLPDLVAIIISISCWKQNKNKKVLCSMLVWKRWYMYLLIRGSGLPGASLHHVAVNGL